MSFHVDAGWQRMKMMDRFHVSFSVEVLVLKVCVQLLTVV